MVTGCGKQLSTEITDSDCCGNGCRNCILDMKPGNNNRAHKAGKTNIILDYNKYKLITKHPHNSANSDVLEMHFISYSKAKSADYILDIPAGHHIMMRSPTTDFEENQGTKSLLRPYSPFWVDITNLEFKILVNVKPNGLMTKYINSLREGDDVEFRGLIGNFELVRKEDVTQNIFIITQGVAIAPAVRVIEEVLADENDVSRVFLFACFQDLKHVLFRDRLQEYNQYWNFKSRVYLSRQKCGSPACAMKGCTDQCEEFRRMLRYKEQVYAHRLDIGDLENVCRNANAAEKRFLLCGTRQFQDQLAELIKIMQIDVKDEEIYKF